VIGQGDVRIDQADGADEDAFFVRLPPAALIERMRKPATGVVFNAQPVTQDCQPYSGSMAKSSGVDQMTRPTLRLGRF